MFEEDIEQDMFCEPPSRSQGGQQRCQLKELKELDPRNRHIK